MSKNLNGYELSRVWFDWCFENPEKVTPNHSALYFFCIEHCNRLGWKPKFGLPTTMAMEAIGIKSYNTYIKTFNNLIDWGFVLLIEKSKNQYSANIVALSNNNKATTKALDKALIKHGTKQVGSTRQSISSIDKQDNNEPIKQDNNKKAFNFRKSLLDYGFEEELIISWLEIRKKKKAVNSEIAFKGFIREIEKVPLIPINDILKKIIEKSWSGFGAAWIKNDNNGQQSTKSGASSFVG